MDNAGIENAKSKSSLVGPRLKVAREALGWDQQVLANRSEMARAAISDFERGARIPSVEQIFRFSDAGSINPAWLLTGVGEMFSTGPTQEQIRVEARQLRNLEVHFLEAINSLFRRYGQDAQRKVWVLGACIKAYYGAHWLGFSDMEEVAQVIESICDRFGLDIVSVLESTAHCNASQYIADWLMHRDVDPEAFGAKYTQDMSDYEVVYHHDLAKPKDVLLGLAKKSKNTHENTQKSKLNQALGYLLDFVRFIKSDNKE